MRKFKPVSSNPDFIALEKKLLKRWYEKGVVKKYLQKNKTSKKYFSFLDGPITANNPMGVHHAWGRTYKDLWQRYKNMQGYRQRFQNGFDCQGLWVEVEVEKELGLKSKRDIESLVPADPKASIAKFVELCKDRVYKFSKIQTEQSKRLGYFMNWDNSYYTLSDENNYMIWHFLKKCYEKGFIYKGRDTVPWCPRCGTAISQHEMLTEDYKEATHDSVFVEYPINGRENEYLLVWTTTPWTLPGNVAVAVDSQKEYVAATGEVPGNIYYLVKTAAERLGLKITETLKGQKLVGLKYSSPFDNTQKTVVSTDPLILPINDEEGTGIVHIAPGAGTEDFQLGKKLDLPVIELIDEEANYLENLGEFSGKNAKKHPELIIDFLKQKDGGKFLFDVVSYTHRYPACWRCKTELVWRVVDEWYVAMDASRNEKRKTKNEKSLREEMKEVARRVNWIPKFGLKRELDWLDNMHDWLISKKRYWGLALPIWECSKCGNFEVIGSRQELKEKAIEGWDKFEGHSPHRPWVDEVRIKCSKCGSLTSRIPDVGNPWLDAGIVPFSTISKDNKSRPLYLEDREQWEKWFPADFITESFPGQFKNWFYSLLVMSTVLENREPFDTVLGFATLLAEDGRPMHKSSGNAIEFNEAADKIGVDIMRWIYSKTEPSQNLLFGYKLAQDSRRRFYLILWNCYKFFIDYANLNNWDCKDSPNVTRSLKIIDKWVLSRLTNIVLKVQESLEKFDASNAAGQLENFIVNDLSTWYIRRGRDRALFLADTKDKNAFLSVLYGVLVTLSKILAPFLPFISEEMYTNLTGSLSVHLENYPHGDQKLINVQLEKEMEKVREVATLGHAARKQAGIPARQPLGKMAVTAPFEKPQESLVQLIEEELNIKKVIWKLSKRTKKSKVILETKITPELEEEGKTRELSRKIQEERKNLNVSLQDKVNVVSDWLPKNPQLLAWLKTKVLASSLTLGDSLKVVK